MSKLFRSADLVGQNGTKVSAKSLESNDVIFLYFSAHWCPPCRGFTPQLAKVYKEFKASGSDVKAEVVFVSGDRDDASFREYFDEMPWLALSYDQRQVNRALNEKFECEGIPYLVAVDAKTGEVLSKQGRSIVMKHGKNFAKFAIEAKKLKAQAEKGIKDLSILGSNVTDENGKSVDLSGCECVVVAFGSPSNRGWAQFVKPKLIEAYDTLKDKMNVVYVSDDASEAKSGPWCFIPTGTSADLFSSFGDVSAPTLMVLQKNSSGEFEVVVEDASRAVYDFGSDAYPWNKEGVMNGRAKAEEKRKEMAKKMHNFDLLKGVSLKDSQGNNVDIDALKKKDVVGLYFSAHWCGPCRGFTPQLAKLYKECKSKGKNFEIIFVSSDRDQSSFDSYFSEMPWVSLDFKERDLKGTLSEIYDVSGIPTLVLLNGDGTEFDREGRKIVSLGADCFPWDKAAIQKANEAKKQKQLEMIKKAEKCGDVILKRVNGSIDGSLSYVEGKNAYDVNCKAFDTFCSESTKSKGKWFYEVNLVSVSNGIAQIGFADDKFNPTSGREGVGDDDHSWGMDGNRVCKWGNSTAAKYGESWKDGDVLGCAIDLDDKYVEFYLNGKSMGKAFEKISFDTSIRVALTGHGQDYKYSVNFSKNTKFPVPAGFKTWGE